MNRDELWSKIRDDESPCSRAEFDQAMDQYDEGRRGDAAVELAVFEAITAEEYTEAQILVRGMAPKDRAVLEFWAGEVAGLVSNVQMSEDRFTS